MPSLKCRLKKLVNQNLLNERDVKRIIVVPCNATNGDMIMILYPDKKIKYNIYGEVEVIGLDIGKTVFTLEWWNAPYEGMIK